MPFAAPMLTDEEEKKKQEQGGVNVSGQSTSFATGVPGQEASGSSKPKSGSGDKFANIQSYLDANESQGDQMGQRVAGDVANVAEDATQKVQSFASKAPTVSAYDPSAAYQNVTSLSDNDKQAYRSAKAGYKGPQSIDQVDGYAETQKAASQAAQKYQNASTESGQQQLLKETYKRPSYSAGENALDQTLVQNSAGSKKAFEDLRSKYAGITSMFDTTANDVGGKLNSAIATGLQNQKKIAEGDAQAKKALMDPIAARAAEMNAQNPELIKRISADAADFTLNDETLQAIGLQEGADTFGLNLQSYLLPDFTVAGINNVANTDERKRYAALTELIDGAAGSDLTMDGKTINPIGFNRAQFDADLIGAKGNYDKELGGYQAQIDRFASDADQWTQTIADRQRNLELYQRELERERAGANDPATARHYTGLINTTNRLLEEARNNLASANSSRDEWQGKYNDFSNTGRKKIKKG